MFSDIRRNPGGQQAVASHQASKRQHMETMPVALSQECSLMLGMIFGRMVGSTEEIGKMVQHTTQIRRDTAQCLATESCSHRAVYTLDTRAGDGDVARPDRHIVQDMCRIDLNHPLFLRIRGRVRQICLDHFWFNGVYWDSNGINDNFVLRSLPKLHQLLLKDGAIYLELSVRIFCRLMAWEGTLNKYFKIGLVHADEVEEIDLVKGSHHILDSLYQCPKTFGKKDRSPEVTLGTSSLEFRQTVSEVLGGSGVVSRFETMIGNHTPVMVQCSVSSSYLKSNFLSKNNKTAYDKFWFIT
jgi:hypothetical protein